MYNLNSDKISKAVQSQFNIWLTDLGDEDKPLTFSDGWAYALICSDFTRLVNTAYKLGRKHERKNRSRKIRMKYKRKPNG